MKKQTKWVKTSEKNKKWTFVPIWLLTDLFDTLHYSFSAAPSFLSLFCFLKESHDKNNWWCLHRIRLPDCTSPHTHTHLKRHTPSIYREILKIREKWTFCSVWPTMTISYSFLFIPLQTWSIRFEENCFFEKISRKCFKKFKIAFWNWLFRKNSSK